MNLGVRYDYMTPATEKNNRMANFDPVAGTLVFAKDGSLEDRALVKPDKNNFSPRVGAIYKINDRTHRPRAASAFSTTSSIASAPRISWRSTRRGWPTSTCRPPARRAVPILRLQDGFPANFLDPANINVARIMVRAADRNSPRTEVRQFGAGIERQIGESFVVVGRRRRLVDRAIWRCCAISTSRCAARSTPMGRCRIPAFGNIQWREMTAEANYKGVDLSFEKRFKDGYSYRTSYTVGEARDQAPGASQRVVRTSAERP